MSYDLLNHRKKMKHTENNNELPRRKQRGIIEGSGRFNVASDGVFDPSFAINMILALTTGKL